MVPAKGRERQALREKREREFVLFVTERGRDFLEERGVAPVSFDDVFDSGRLALEPELRRGDEDALEPVRRQILQRRLATARARQRDIRGKLVRERGRIDAHLWHVAVRFGGGEKSAFTLLDEDVKNGIVERRVHGTAKRFPTAIGQVVLDRAASRL